MKCDDGDNIRARTNRNARALRLLRAIELFAGAGKCPVCGSPARTDKQGKPSRRDRDLQELHDDKCELAVMVQHFESCVEFPGIW